MEYKKLNSGMEVPMIGLGLWGVSGDDVISSVSQALRLGYRLIDTAAYYKNEPDIPAGISESGISRSEIKIATKVWYEDMKAGKIEASLEQSLKNLKTDYLDLYLLHWPLEDVKYSWRYLESMQEQKVIRSIGVCNFQKHHLEELSTYANVKPALNQIESNPEFQQDALVKYCQAKGIDVQAWGPLGKGKSLSNPAITELAEKYGRTPAQIILRWHMERGVLVIPKSIHKARLIENLDISGFSLTDEDMEKIKVLETGITYRGYQPGYTWK